MWKERKDPKHLGKELNVRELRKEKQEELGATYGSSLWSAGM